MSYPDAMPNLYDIDSSEYIGTGLGSAPSGFGQYDKLFASNPYRNLQYKESLWQKIASSLGFRTGADKWREDAAINSAEYDAGIFSMIQQNEYNSPVEQAQRMRSAGLNPDLLGVGDVAPGAKPTEDPNGMQPTSDGFSELQIVGKVGSALVNLIPQTMSFMTNLTQLKGIRMDNDLKELTFNSDITQFVEDFFKQGITKKDYEDAFSSQDFENLLTASEKNSNDLASRLFSSRRAQKNFKMNYGRYARSLVAEMSKYKSYQEFEDARKGILTTRSSQYFSDDQETMMNLIKSYLGPFERYQKRVNEINERIANLRNPDLEQGAKNAGLATEKAYQETLDGTLVAETENAGNEYQKQLFEIMKATDDMFAEIMQGLDALDSWYTPVAKALVGIARSQLLSGFHLNLGMHSASYTNPTTGAVSESSGFHFGF